jgi:hypothetical protein
LSRSFFDIEGTYEYGFRRPQFVAPFFNPAIRLGELDTDLFAEPLSDGLTTPEAKR